MNCFAISSALVTCESGLAVATHSVLVLAVTAYETHPCRVSASSSSWHSLCPPDCSTLADSCDEGAASFRAFNVQALQCTVAAACRSFPNPSFDLTSNELVAGSFLLELPDFCETPSTCRFREGGPSTGPMPQLTICSWIFLSRVPSLGLTCFIAPLLLRHLFQCQTE